MESQAEKDSSDKEDTAGAEKGREEYNHLPKPECLKYSGVILPLPCLIPEPLGSLVRPFLLEIILPRGMRSHCCTCRLQKQVWALGTGAVHLHVSWPERKLVSHFIQNKPVRPNLGQCGRCCCRYQVFLAVQHGIFDT